jgi:Skp family chaperone for outer membrane proteins
MKRAFILFAISVLLLRLPAVAQETTSTLVTNAPTSSPASTAATIAAKEDADERFQRLITDLQAVQSDNEALHAKITAMEQEIQALRDAAAHPVDNSANQDELKRLAEKIEEVDKKRLEDKDVISEEIRKTISGLQATIQGAPSAPHESRPKLPIVPESAASANGYSYTIVDGDRLDLIVKAYNKDFKVKGLKPITLKQAKEANPNVDWNRLRVGQKIVIPRPDGG